MIFHRLPAARPVRSGGLWRACWKLLPHARCPCFPPPSALHLRCHEMTCTAPSQRHHPRVARPSDPPSRTPPTPVCCKQACICNARLRLGVRVVVLRPRHRRMPPGLSCWRRCALAAFGGCDTTTSMLLLATSEVGIGCAAGGGGAGHAAMGSQQGGGGGAPPPRQATHQDDVNALADQILNLPQEPARSQGSQAVAGQPAAAWRLQARVGRSRLVNRLQPGPRNPLPSPPRTTPPCL